ncbi:UDP-N-acetylmuramoyl-L-alanine--D-glutamate ligase [Lachnoclostridium sp. An169]|uniref:UDP-N-acetylmuramoyl-L-alanine--D-glutamate ligase n=1 Tax=Lachnoclostridium sp. An169 TaxID=1965569 RepID=UPI000B383018|nr:UDP-N-acetylmuramoyl-L-alanine--D-glutamate ligase [Lachnoclostridium sp. An169]OUP86558.1 UDP-N-acetylmuramoyl-L-alanine--D-glutamate ligase [Lachnoclostridium sp. An169]
MELNGKKVLVFGSGISGEAAARLLLGEGAQVVLYDGNDKLDRKEILGKTGAAEEGREMQVILGTLDEEHARDMLSGVELAVLSPGVPTDLPLVEMMKEMGIPVWGEIELAYTTGRGDVLAITGTNGKTTTTTLLGEIMKNYNESTFVVGNIGNPYTSIVTQTTDHSVIVAEMSSFQLETIHSFRPKVSAILNITPDHLNRHHTMEAYIAAKERIAENQTEEDTCVLNYEDEVLRVFAENVKADVLYFSSRRKLKRGLYLEDGEIVCDLGERMVLCRTDELKILGTHNYENVMAAAAMALAYGVPADVVRSTVKEFQGVAHRIEFIAEKNGVAYYNDSKGTNPDAAIRGIRAMNRPTVLIGGGYDKDSTYDEWIEAFDGKVKKLVLLGATRDKIAECARKHGFTEIEMADSFEEAFEKCVECASPGDAVLLSPACASWGMFRNYEERGDKFRELVNQL